MDEPRGQEHELKLSVEESGVDGHVQEEGRRGRGEREKKRGKGIDGGQRVFATSKTTTQTKRQASSPGAAPFSKRYAEDEEEKNKRRKGSFDVVSQSKAVGRRAASGGDKEPSVLLYEQDHLAAPGLGTAALQGDCGGTNLRHTITTSSSLLL